MTIIRIVIVINTFVSVRWIQIIFLWILILFSYFLEWNSPDILALSEINLDDSIDSGNFPVTVYLRLVRKDSITHMHLLTLYVKEELCFHGGLISGKLCRFLLMLSTVFTSLSFLLLFPLSITFCIFFTFFIFLHGTCLWKTLQILTYAINSFYTSLSFLLLSPLLTTFFVFMHGFWFYFT